MAYVGDWKVSLWDLLEHDFPFFKVSGFHTNFVKTDGVKQELCMMNINVKCMPIYFIKVS
jgi:hypothetical protein